MGFLSRRRKIAFGLIVVAFVPYAVASWHINRYNWTPLSFSVQLHQGEIRTPEFLAEVGGTYILYLEVQSRRIEFQRQECLLDLESFHPELCSSIPNVVDLSWILWRGPAAVADSTSEQSWKAGSYSNVYTRREIGRFRAERGEHYAVSIDFHRDPTELNIASPKIVAETIQDWDGFAIETQLSFLFGVLVATSGIVLLIRSRAKAG
jgi:hypothetical protein